MWILKWYIPTIHKPKLNQINCEYFNFLQNPDMYKDAMTFIYNILTIFKFDSCKKLARNESVAFID